MSRAIRLVFDAHAIAPHRSGIGDYSYLLVQSLLEFHSSEIELHLFASGAIHRVQSMDDVDAVTAGVQPGSLYAIGNQRILPRLLRAGKYDLLHTPDYCIPLLPISVPVISTIHDIVPIAYSQMMLQSKKVKLLWLYKWYIGQTLRRSRAIITDSAFSKSEMVRYFPVSAEHIHTIPLAPFLSPVKDFQPSDAVSSVDAGKYLLFVGRHEPYKGIRQLLEAFAAVRERLYPRVTHLVFAGKIDERYPWSEISRELGLQEHIVFTGYISERQLSWVYAHAAAFVFPSLYEGFGLPPLDAMAHGVPVAASNRASIPEVTGDATLQFDPENAQEFQNALIEVTLNGNLRSDLISRGNERLEAFSWELVARRTVEVYEKVVNR